MCPPLFVWLLCRNLIFSVQTLKMWRRRVWKVGKGGERVESNEQMGVRGVSLLTRVEYVRVHGSIPLRGVWVGCSSSFLRPWAHRWISHLSWDAWPVRRQTYGYLPSRRAWLPCDRYQIILLGDRGTCMWTTCLRLLPDSRTIGTRTCESATIESQFHHYTTTLHGSIGGGNS